MQCSEGLLGLHAVSTSGAWARWGGVSGFVSVVFCFVLFFVLCIFVSTQ